MTSNVVVCSGSPSSSIRAFCSGVRLTAEVIEREDAIAVRVLDAIEETRTRPARRYAEAAFENVPWMNRSERSGETGLAGSSAPAASVSLVTFSQPSLSPRFFHAAFSNASASLRQHEAHGLVGGDLGDLDHDRLDRLADQAARGGLPHGDLEPHLGRPAHAAARRLNRQVKRQRPGRMADRENRGLARLEVVASGRARRSRPPGRASPAAGSRMTSSATRDSVGQKLRRQSGQVGRRRARGPAGRAGAPDLPPGRIDLDGHVLLGSTADFLRLHAASAAATCRRGRRGAARRVGCARGASMARASASSRRRRAPRRRRRRVERVPRKNALRVEQRVHQRLIGLVARPEHVVLEPLLRVRESASEIDVHVGRVHQRRGTAGRKRHRVLGKRQLDVPFGKARVLPAVGMCRADRAGPSARRDPARRQNRSREASAPSARRRTTGTRDPRRRDGPPERTTSAARHRSTVSRSLASMFRNAILAATSSASNAAGVDAGARRRERRRDLLQPLEPVREVRRSRRIGHEHQPQNQVVAFDLFRQSG